MDINKLRTTAGKFSQLYERFSSTQEGACRLVANISNITSRLPPLQNIRNYSGFRVGEDLQRKLLSKQLKSFENAMERLMATMQEMEDVVKLQERLCVESLSLLGPAPAMELCGRPQGCVVSATQLVEAMEDVWCMCRDELCLKMALLTQLQYGVKESDGSLASSLFADNIHIMATSPAIILLQNLGAMS